MDQIKVYAKTLAAFVAGVVANAVVNLVNGETPWPQNSAQWVQWAVTTFGAAIAVSLTRNKITQQQLDKDPNVVGGTVVPSVPAPPKGGYKNPWGV